MKTDTEYFALAVAQYCKGHAIGKDMPLTMSQLSEVLIAAQALKDADRKRIEDAARQA